MQTMTEVASALAAPSTPSVIGRLLGDLAVAYREVPDHPGLDPARKVHAVLLDDSIGPLLVLFTQNHLLDLNRLADLTGRRMTAVAPERLQVMLDKHGLSQLPGLPALVNSPCLYEEHLLQQPSLLISTGEPDLLLEITQQDFRPLLKNASAGRFGEPLGAITPDLARGRWRGHYPGGAGLHGAAYPATAGGHHRDATADRECAQNHAAALRP
jgi:prolyl-tRNA editing enzyme YbaK/EbsC (Cys-tRNA(Pro) deacylase)